MEFYDLYIPIFEETPSIVTKCTVNRQQKRLKNIILEDNNALVYLLKNKGNNIWKTKTGSVRLLQGFKIPVHFYVWHSWEKSEEISKYVHIQVVISYWAWEFSWNWLQFSSTVGIVICDQWSWKVARILLDFWKNTTVPQEITQPCMIMCY